MSSERADSNSTTNSTTNSATNSTSGGGGASASRPAGVNRLEDLLTQLEGNGYQRNGHDEILQKAADAETYYGDNDLAIDVLRSKYLAPKSCASFPNLDL